MNQLFKPSDLSLRFPTNDDCLEEIKKLKYPRGINCSTCNKITKHYKIENRTAYECEFCRKQTYPLKGTIFEKTSTPLKIWFYAMLLMTYTHGKISAKKLQKELGVTYKTAWKMSKKIKALMAQNNGDLLTESEEVFKWTLFNKLEFKMVQKKSS